MKDKNFRFYWQEPYEKKDPNIKIEVPGFGKDEIRVNLTTSSITVSASKKDHRVKKGRNFYREEAFASSFSRTTALPHKIRPEDFDVVIKDGVVMLKRKKKKEVEAK